MSAFQSDIAAYESLGPGRPFGSRYALVSLLGRGGFGKVFLARDLALEIPVALKVLNPILASDSGQLARFKREVIIARKISHPNVCKIFDFGQIETLTYLSMEYVHGQNLYAVLRGHRSLGVKTSLDLCREIASALEAAHREGIVHRDLKPHNVMVDTRGLLKIMDFGIARSADMGGITHTGTVMGSPSYMSPEQCRGEAGDHRSDLYSLGVVLYQMLTGVSPFVGNTPLGTLYLHIQQLPRPPIELVPSLPAEVNAMILKCMAKHPEERYPSAAALREEMGSFLRQEYGSDEIDRAEMAALVQIEEEHTPTVPVQALPTGDSPPGGGHMTTVGLVESESTGELHEDPPDPPGRVRPTMLPTMRVSPEDVPPVNLPPPATPPPPSSAAHPPPAARDPAPRPTAPRTEAPAGQAGAPDPPVGGRPGRTYRWIALGVLLGGAAISVPGWLLRPPPAAQPDVALREVEAPAGPSAEEIQQAKIRDLLASAEALRESGEIDSGPQGGAAAAYKRVLLLDPTNPVAMAALGNIVAGYRQQAIAALGAGRYQTALELSQAALVQMPDDALSRDIFRSALDRMVRESGATSASIVRARQLIASNEPEAARILLREILASEPDNAEATALDRRAKDLAQRLKDEASEARKAEEARWTENAKAPTAAPTAAGVPAATTPPSAETASPTPELAIAPADTPSAEPEPGPDAPVEGQLVEPGPGIAPPTLLEEARLKLPPAFVSLYRGKSIEVSVLVGESGEVLDAKILDVPQSRYNPSIVQQLQRLKFRPALAGQVRVRCWHPMRIAIQ